MSAGANANKFYREVATSNAVWTIGDASGLPLTVTSNGFRVMPLWSSKKRVEKIIATVSGYSACIPLGSTWDDFEANWPDQLAKQGYLSASNGQVQMQTATKCQSTFL